MLSPVMHVLPLTKIRRERVLPIPGKILVRQGQRVNATDTVAECNLNREYLLLDLTRSLGLPAKKADKYLQVQEGAQVAEGDLLAGPVGMFQRKQTAPAAGRVVIAGDGQILLEVKTKPFELKAGIPGEVVDLISERGLVLETTGALIQGVWGNGRSDYGLLNMMLSESDLVLTPDKLDVSQRGSVVVGGHCEQAEVLQAAAELPLKGLILASMRPELASLALQLPVPVMVLEGFGQRPVNLVTYKLLSTSGRRDVALNADAWDRFRGTRPEAVIPLPANPNIALPRDAEFFAPGQQVRSIRAPQSGQVGTIVQLPGMSVFPSGVRAQAAEVRLESGETVMLPLDNLEVLI